MKFKNTWARGGAIGAGLGVVAPLLVVLIWGGDQGPLLLMVTAPAGLMLGMLVGAVVGILRK